MVVKIALDAAGVVDTLAWRFLLAFTVFCVYLVVARKPIRWSWATMLKMLPLAICYPIAFFTFQACGVSYISSAEAGI